MAFKSGFVAIIGHPNVGKSTLINRLVGEKIAITSPKAQTTRDVIRGIYTDDSKQIIFLDTPGVHKSKSKLNNYMNKEAKASIYDVDAIILVVEATEEVKEYSDMLDMLKDTKVPVILVINKIDLQSSRTKLEVLVVNWYNSFNFASIIPISATKDEEFNAILDEVNNVLVEGPMYYPADMVSDEPTSFIIKEIIREKILLFTQQEVPHCVAISIDKISERDTCIDINASIIVERTSQKQIIIGKSGSMIKKIGTSARKEIVKLFDKKINLMLFVRVEDNWRNSDNYLKEFGYKNNG